MALTADQQQRLQEIQDRADQIQQDAALSLLVKLMSVGLLAMSSTSVLTALASGTADVGFTQAAEADVKAKMQELIELRQEQLDILESDVDAPSIVITITIPTTVITTSGDDGTSRVITIPTVVIGPDTDENAGGLTIPEVPIQIDDGDGPDTITLPEITITGSLTGSGRDGKVVPGTVGPPTGEGTGSGSLTVAVDGSEGMIVGSGHFGLGEVTVAVDGSEGLVIPGQAGQPGFEAGQADAE